MHCSGFWQAIWAEVCRHKDCSSDGVVDRDRFDVKPDPVTTFYFDADPDPDAIVKLGQVNILHKQI